MSEAEEFLRRNPTQYCATIGKDGRPKVSPFRMMYCEGDDIYYCTGAKKAVYAELQANPYPEICACEGLRRLRISGKAEGWTIGPQRRKPFRRADRCVRYIAARTIPISKSFASPTLPSYFPIFTGRSRTTRIDRREGGSYNYNACAALDNGSEDKKTLYLELGVGLNTPGIIKFPFWRAVRGNDSAKYVSVDISPVRAPFDLPGRMFYIDDHIGAVLARVRPILRRRGGKNAD